MQTVDCPKAAFFDLDDTLAPSFESPSPEMVAALRRLIALMPVGIVTGRDFAWMSKDFLPKVVAGEDHFYLISESGAQGLFWNGESWEPLYEQSISAEERALIHEAVEAAVRQTGVLDGLPRFGEQFVDRKAAVAYSCTGWDTPPAVRYSWDPGNVRRAKLRDAIAIALPQYEVLLGGATTIDVTRKGINKGYGIRALSERLGIATADMLYVGDSLFPGGNDYAVIETGVRTRPTTGPGETLRIIDQLLAACAAQSPAGNV